MWKMFIRSWLSDMKSISAMVETTRKNVTFYNQNVILTSLDCAGSVQPYAVNGM